MNTILLALASDVLILILMEDTLRGIAVRPWDYLWVRLNPYSNGRYSESISGTPIINTKRMGLNPYSNGRYSESDIL